jgi:hypothetical protein
MCGRPFWSLCSSDNLAIPAFTWQASSDNHIFDVNQLYQVKPPQAAVVKSNGGERCGNVGTRFRQAKLREASVSEPLRKCRNEIRSNGRCHRLSASGKSGFRLWCWRQGRSGQSGTKTMIQDEIRRVRRDLLAWAWTKPEPIRVRAVIIVGNLYRLEHWPDDRLMQFETLRNIAGLERALSDDPARGGGFGPVSAERSSRSLKGNSPIQFSIPPEISKSVRR